MNSSQYLYTDQMVQNPYMQSQPSFQVVPHQVQTFQLAQPPIQIAQPQFQIVHPPAPNIHNQTSVNISVDKPPCSNCQSTLEIR